MAAAIKHPRQHRHVEVGVVVHAHFTLAVIEAVQPAGILRNRPVPRNRQRQKKRIQPGVIKTLAHITASGQDQASLPHRNGSHASRERVKFLFARTSALCSAAVLKEGPRTPTTGSNLLRGEVPESAVPVAVMVYVPSSVPGILKPPPSAPTAISVAGGSSQWRASTKRSLGYAVRLLGSDIERF